MTKIGKSKLNNLLSFFYNGGDHYFQDKRMILSSTDAWGVLRKDLIDTLGIQRAKRFLLRYGWNCGKNEAKLLKNMIEWEDDLEWLVAGSQMHQIGGRVFSYPEQFNVDMTKGIFDVSGHWIDSYEAKQHLQHYPLYHEPICYFLAGYGGGYTSECLGKKVIFKETHCVGKGDSQCRYDAKTIDLWGDEIDDELFNYEEQDIADELDIVYRRVEKQKEVLHIGSSITKKLTASLLQGKDLDVFAQVLGAELKLPVFIYDQYFGYIADYSTNKVSRETIEPFIKKEVNSDLKFAQTKMLELEENQWILISPIVIQNEIYGYIFIYSDSQKFGPAEVDFLERAASICAVKMLNERTAIHTEERMKGELLEELFKDETDTTYITKRFSYLGYNINQPHYVMLIEFNDTVDYTQEDVPMENKFQKLKKQLTEFLNKEELHYNTPFIKVEKMNKMGILIPNQFLQQKHATIQQFSSQCYETFESKKGLINVYIGVSKLCKEVGDFSRKHNEAKKAIEFAKMKSQLMNESVNGVIFAEDIGHILILLDARKPNELLEFAHSHLLKLKKYEEKNHTELLKTLYYYLENECNLHKTARVMNVSISGMRYRIQRIEELTGLDLSTSSSRFEIQLSIQIYMVFDLL